MTFEKYFCDVNITAQIEKLAKKYKNKKIVLYGAGEYFDEIYDNYDLSKLNIIGISDIRFQKSKESNRTTYKALAPSELKDYDFDLIILTVFEELRIIHYFQTDLFKNSKNKHKKVIPIVKPSIFYMLKVLFSGKYYKLSKN